MKRPQRKAEQTAEGRGTIIRRAKRRHQEHEPEERTPRGMKFHKVKRLNATLSYRKFTNKNDEEVRWYVLGAIKIAFVHIYKESSMRSGNVQVSMNSRIGNGGDWFDSVQEAKAFIINELKRSPTP